jgi:hypothetical protein
MEISFVGMTKVTRAKLDEALLSYGASESSEAIDVGQHLKRAWPTQYRSRASLKEMTE